MIKIRLATTADMERVFDLSNDESVRRVSINKQRIEWNDHAEWFNKRIKDQANPFYIVESEDGDFVGQVRFEDECGEKVISISISRNYRGKGLSKEIIDKTIEQSGFKEVVAYIFDDNIASMKAFEKCGFANTHLLKYKLIKP